ncbi:hypothetical protein SRHO_G00211160 [Serrasalmus rhombeus]
MKTAWCWCRPSASVRLSVTEDYRSALLPIQAGERLEQSGSFPRAIVALFTELDQPNQLTKKSLFFWVQTEFSSTTAS